MNHTPVRIVFVDLAADPGGGLVSLQLLAQGLDRQHWQPAAAIMNRANPTAARWAAQGLFVQGVLTVDSRQGAGDSYPAAAERVRHSRMVARLRPWPGFTPVWQGAGMVVRLLRDVLPQAIRLRALLAQQRAGLVHLNDVVPVNRAAVLAAHSLDLPIVCHVRGLDPLTWLDRQLTRAVDGFIFISWAVAEQQRQAGAHIRCGRVVYNGLDLASFPLDVSAVTLRQALQIPADVYLVGSVGRLVAWKGHDVALRALARLRRAGVPAHLLVVGGTDVGEPAYAQELHRLAAALGIESHVTFAGYRDDIPRVMGALDVFVHCAVAPEPFGRVVIEAMAAQRPIVGSAAGGVLEIIRSGVDGLLTPPGDIDALAAALLDLWRHPEKAQALAAAARARVGTEFTQVRYVAGVQAVYTAVMAQRRRLSGSRE